MGIGICDNGSRECNAEYILSDINSVEAAGKHWNLNHNALMVEEIYWNDKMLHFLK